MRQRARDERGQVVVLFALLLPMLLALGAVVVGLGNWFTHAKNLQTKVDAAAFAGGAMWGFPCGSDIDSRIEEEARLYFGSHTAADLTSVPSPHNPQVGGIAGDRIYVSLNQDDWWRGSFPASDFSSPAGSVCQSKILDVKATEQDVSPLWRLIPLFPDIKRKARVQIEEIDGLTGLLPIAVRLPQPLSAAAIFYDEGDTATPKRILDVKPLRQVCLDPDDTLDCIVGVPPGLGHWTTAPDPADATGTWASVNVAAKTGVVIATSVRPACGTGTPPAGPPCLSTAPSLVGTPIDDLCGGSGTAVQCFDADGSGAAQTVRAGLHFIQGYRPGPAVTDGRPELRRSWIENVDCPPAGYAGGYFNSASSACRVKLTVELDVGSVLENGPPNPPDDVVQTRVASNVQMRYCLVRTGQTGPEACDPDLGASQFGVNQDMQCSGGPGIVTCSTVGLPGPLTHPLIATDSRENAFAIQVHLHRTSVAGHPLCSNDQDDESFPNSCRFFYTGAGYIGDSLPPSGTQVLAAPVQRTYMGSLERTTPIEWLRLTMDPDCDRVNTPDDLVPGHVYPPDPEQDAASQPIDTTRCYIVDLGTAGGLARNQDEPPIAFNLGDNSSQRAYVDCDGSGDLPNLKSEIVAGCRWPPYSANKFDTTPYCPDHNGWFSTPKPAPFANWPPFRCVLTQTGNSSQVIQGFNERIFNKTNNPNCPDEDLSNPGYVKGRNYWHRLNNAYDDETFAWDGTGPQDLPLVAKGNTLRSDDPRLVMLFFTTYDSFTDTGNETYPIVGFGSFYVTGYGEVISGNWKGGAPEDPCDQGNGLALGAGNDPPPDIDLSRNTRWVWGHFVNDVVPAPFSTGGSGALCNPEASFQPCVAVLVE